ncbi:hypothetical protein THASP1DRAFT_22092 [Thamnocephalis sphaerospora]|uniref:Ricin B lectin domain-containing protein n=1 Tax=Thamnocephalis sphaerospora TaxID=78915 RepID=A0A4P9XV66_9FUNG|nr:hypothetical protein THASP1DRAFT_22092 [Thamnocephalis sphaerospora]|eukprot:RKP10153.1 hypothetical protein THASP1DRAFT_22092 [Thamnocephalis sphaerospora]
MAGCVLAQNHPANYVKDDTFRLYSNEGKCLRPVRGNDPWFSNCNGDDPLDFDAFWEIVWRKDKTIETRDGPATATYYSMCSVTAGLCLTRRNKALAMESYTGEEIQLWRPFVNNGRIKWISEKNDLEGQFTCLSSDSNVSYKGHLIEEKCHGDSERQRTTNPNVPKLPRW